MRETEAPDFNPTQDLSFYLNAVRNRWWLLSLSGLTCTCLAYVIALSQEPQFESQMRLIRNATVELPGAGTEGSNAGVNRSLDRAAAADQLVKSPRVLLRAKELQRGGFGDRELRDLYANTQAEMDKQNPILTVVYRDRSPSRVVSYLGALAQAFLEEDLEARRLSANQAIKYLESTMPEARKTLEGAQRRYQNFLRANKSVSPSKLQEALSSNSLTLDREIQSQRLALQGLEGTRARLIGRLGVGEDQALATAALSSDINYQKTIDLLQTQYTALAQKQQLFTDRHPEITGLRKQIAATEQRLREQAGDILNDRLFKQARTGLPDPNATQLDTAIDVDVQSKSARATGDQPLLLPLPNTVRSSLTAQLVDVETKIASARANLSALELAKGSVRSNLDGLAEKVVEEASLANQVDRSLKVLNNLNDRVEFYRLAKAQQVTPWSVLEPAQVPDTPVAPKPVNNALFGLAVGSVLGFLLAYYLELRNNRLRQKEDFEKILGVPMLGALPYSQAAMTVHLPNEPVPEADEEDFSFSQFFAGIFRNPFRRRSRRRQGTSSIYQSVLEKARIRESFRRIATRLLFAKPNAELRTICITSCVASEGKSVCSFQTAHALAELGKRVLLIDADMRRPTLHRLAEIGNPTGLSSLLASATLLPAQVIRSDVNHLSFDLMTAGPVPPNPIALLSSKRFIAVLDSLRREYDIVIIDTPPTNTFADSQVIAAFIDSVLFVVSRGRLKAQNLIDAKNNFVPYTGKFVGFVINSTTEGNDGDDAGDVDYAHYYSDEAGLPEGERRRVAADEE
jgi:capsular exopolysaccharide synthesis family protein